MRLIEQRVSECVVRVQFFLKSRTITVLVLAGISLGLRRTKLVIQEEETMRAKHKLKVRPVFIAGNV